MNALFTLVRQLANRSRVTDVAAPKWLVQRHGLAALAARAGAHDLREDLVRATVEWARIERELPGVIAALVAADIPVAPIKGVAYAKGLYASPAERPMSDIDLLVPRRDHERAERALEQLGFVRAVSPVMHHAQAWFRGELVIDLHHNIIATGRSRIDLDAVWSRTHPAWPAGAVELEPTDALIFHLVNLTRNRLRAPLVAVVDAARLLERVSDEQNALARARTWNLGAAAAASLRFCHAILDGSDERPVGWFGPTLHDVAMLAEPTAMEKMVFDIAVAGSPSQLAARAVQFGANRVRSLLRRS